MFLPFFAPASRRPPGPAKAAPAREKSREKRKKTLDFPPARIILVAEPAGWPPGDYLWKKSNRLFHSFPLHKTKTTSPQAGGFPFPYGSYRLAYRPSKAGAAAFIFSISARDSSMVAPLPER